MPGFGVGNAGSAAATTVVLVFASITRASATADAVWVEALVDDERRRLHQRPKTLPGSCVMVIVRGTSASASGVRASAIKGAGGVILPTDPRCWESPRKRGHSPSANAAPPRIA